MDNQLTIIRFFQEGGVFMYPIALVLTFGLAIAIERWLFVSSTQLSNRRALKKLIPLLNKGEHRSALSFTEKSKAPVSMLIRAGIRTGLANNSNAQNNPNHRMQKIEYAIEESLLDTAPRLAKRTPYLATLANIATLLGLLGTIIGLIAAFTAVANADPAEKATLLSQSISVAMNTTAFGLMVAIPLLLIHALIQSKTVAVMEQLEKAGAKCLNLSQIV